MSNPNHDCERCRADALVAQLAQVTFAEKLHPNQVIELFVAEFLSLTRVGMPLCEGETN